MSILTYCFKLYIELFDMVFIWWAYFMSRLCVLQEHLSYTCLLNSESHAYLATLNQNENSHLILSEVVWTVQ